MDLLKNLFHQLRHKSSNAPKRHVTIRLPEDSDSVEKHVTNTINLEPTDITAQVLNADNFSGEVRINSGPKNTDIWVDYKEFSGQKDKVIVEPIELFDVNDPHTNVQKFDLRNTQVAIIKVAENDNDFKFDKKIVSNLHGFDDILNEIVDPLSKMNDVNSNKNIDEKTLKGLKEFNDILNNLKLKNGFTSCNNTDDLEKHTLDEINEFCEQDIKETSRNSDNNIPKVSSINEDHIQIKTKSSTTNVPLISYQNASNLYVNNVHEQLHEYQIQNEKFCEQTSPEDEVIHLNSDKSVIGTIFEVADTENFDTISISLTESLKHTENQYDSDCGGYHSSDFEFITESEAELEGLIVNYARIENEAHTFKTVQIIRDVSFNRKYNAEPGPSIENPKSYRENHNIPEGEEYLNLFRGIYDPVLPAPAIHFLENKCVRSSTCMQTQPGGIGFNVKMMQLKNKANSSDDEFKEDAEKCAQKILQMYPRNNRKRRRRI